MLASLIKKTFQIPQSDHNNANGIFTPISTKPFASSPKIGPDSPNELTILNNDDPNEGKLDFLLGLGASDGSKGDSSCSTVTTPAGGHSAAQLPVDDVKVDVTLRTQLGQAPALMLLITDHKNPKEDTGSQLQTPRLIAISVEVGLNGQISVLETAGLTNGGDAEMQGTDDSDPAAEEIRKQIPRVLEVSQDLGILVEWVLRWLQQRAGG